VRAWSWNWASFERHLVAGDLEVQVEVDPYDLIVTGRRLEGS
jgi:hypothetical protein